MTNVADQEPVEPETPAEDLNDEITRKYDPERLLKMIGRRAGKGEALEHSIRNKYEKRFGVDLGHVRIYTGEFAEEFNKKREAYAVTVGATGMILMGGSAEKSVGQSSGQALLAHELTHVAQAQRNQGGGLHRKGTTNTAMPFGEEHEAEAEAHEHEVAHEGAQASSGAGAAAKGIAAAAAKAQMEEAMLKVRERVLDMAADAARTFSYRNGLQRRG
jgi:hypothetical protein